MKNSFFILSIALLFLASGCTKSGSKKWIVADISVRSALDDSPVPCRVELQYTVNGMFGSFVEKKDLGTTDENGGIVIQESVLRKTVGHRLNLYSKDPGYIKSYANSSNYPEVISLTHKGKNKKTIRLSPSYFHIISIKNINCEGELDSMWINSHSYAYTGCVDINYSNTGTADPMPVKNPVVQYNVRIKRNGVVTNLQKSFVLQLGILNKVLIEY